LGAKFWHVQSSRTSSFRFVRKAIDAGNAGRNQWNTSGGEIVRDTHLERSAEQKMTDAGKRGARLPAVAGARSLPPLVIPQEKSMQFRETPRVARARRARWIKEISGLKGTATRIDQAPKVAGFEETLASSPKTGDKSTKLGKVVANFVQAEVLRHMRTDGRPRFPTTLHL
jgi:hypothetical protein